MAKLGLATFIDSKEAWLSMVALGTLELMGRQHCMEATFLTLYQLVLMAITQ